MKEGRRVQVVAHEDRELAEPALTAQRLGGDEVGDGVGLLCAADLLDVLDVDGFRRPPAEMLVDAERRLKAIAVVRDQAVSGIKQALRRAPVLDERNGEVLGIRLAEAIEVAQRSAAPREDRLVVVADHGEVAVRLGEEADQLELRVVGVLELIDQDVAEAAPQALRRGGVLATETQRERDLVTNVDYT